MATLGTRERGALTHPDLHRLDDVNRDVLKMLTTPGKGWWILFGIAAAGVAASAAVEEAIAIIESSQPPLPYDELRRRAYPDIGDQLDDLFKQGAFSGDMAAVLQAVKDAHPKG